MTETTRITENAGKYVLKLESEHSRIITSIFFDSKPTDEQIEKYKAKKLKELSILKEYGLAALGWNTDIANPTMVKMISDYEMSWFYCEVTEDDSDCKVKKVIVYFLYDRHKECSPLSRNEMLSLMQLTEV